MVHFWEADASDYREHFPAEPVFSARTRNGFGNPEMNSP
jgi:hypothetical protein